MLVSTYFIDHTPVSVFISFIDQIISSVNVFLEISPVQKLSDLTILIICGSFFECPFPTCWLLTWDLTLFSVMEDLDSRLFIARVEGSCWQDQLRQAVRISYLSIFRPYFLNFHFIYPVLICISF